MGGKRFEDQDGPQWRVGEAGSSVGSGDAGPWSPERTMRPPRGARPVAAQLRRTHGAHVAHARAAGEADATTVSRRRHAWLAALIGALVGPVLALVSGSLANPLVLLALPAVAWAWSPGAKDPVRDFVLIVGTGAASFGVTWALLAGL